MLSTSYLFRRRAASPQTQYKSKPSLPEWALTRNQKVFDGAVTLSIGTLLILTTVCAWGLLLAAGAVQAVLLGVIKREWSKLDGAAEVQKKYATCAAEVAVLR